MIVYTIITQKIRLGFKTANDFHRQLLIDLWANQQQMVSM
jgi:hypothetical protein